IFSSRLYLDIKKPPVSGCPTIGGHFISQAFNFLCAFNAHPQIPFSARTAKSPPHKGCFHDTIRDKTKRNASVIEKPNG
ncbi:hypothetical protein, partial [Photorhabdus asymbiotica]